MERRKLKQIIKRKKHIFNRGVTSVNLFKSVAWVIVGMAFSFLYYILLLANEEIFRKDQTILNTIGVLFAIPFTLLIVFSQTMRTTILIWLPSLGKRECIVLFGMITLSISTDGPMKNINYNTHLIMEMQRCAGKALLKKDDGSKPMIAERAQFSEKFGSILSGLDCRGVRLVKSLHKVADAFSKISEHSGGFLSQVFGKIKEWGNSLCSGIVNVFVSSGSKYHGGCNLKKLVGFIAYKLLIEDYLNELKSIRVNTIVQFESQAIFGNSAVDKTFAAIKNATQSALADFISFTKKLKEFGILSLLITILPSLLYVIKYNRKLGHDNKFISPELVELDIHNYKTNVAYVLPLSFKERGKYIIRCSPFLSTKEKRNLILNFSMMVIYVFVPAVMIAGDYASHTAALTTIQLIQSSITESAHSLEKQKRAEFKSEEELEDYELMLKETFDVAEAYKQINKCIGVPLHPDESTNIKVSIMVTMCFVLCCFSPYLLRLRSVICDAIYPDRCRARTIWLQRQIYFKRATLGNYIAGRTGTKDLTNLPSFGEVCKKTFPFLAGGKNKKPQHCYICAGATLQDKIFKDYIKCFQAGCSAIYCMKCVRERPLKRCTVCNTIICIDAVIKQNVLDSSDEEADHRPHSYQLKDDIKESKVLKKVLKVIKKKIHILEKLYKRNEKVKKTIVKTKGFYRVKPKSKKAKKEKAAKAVKKTAKRK